MNKKNIGIEVKAPEKECKDKNCPFHGNLKVHGRIFTGKVTSDKMSKTATIMWERTIYIPKYERYEVQRSKVKAHNPECINAKMGDNVRIIQCRPLSKMKSFVIVSKGA